MSFVRTDKILPLTIFLCAKMLIPAQSVKINLIKEVPCILGYMAKRLKPIIPRNLEKIENYLTIFEKVPLSVRNETAVSTQRNSNINYFPRP